MIIRTLLLGTLLGGLSGAAVFYGLGETDSDVETADAAVSDIVTPSKPLDINDEAEKDTNEAETSPKDLADKEKNDAAIGYGSGADNTSETPSPNTSKSDISSNEASTHETNSAHNKVKAMMKPRATGSFIVEDDQSKNSKQKDTLARDNMTSPVTNTKPAQTKTPPIETAQVDMDEAEVQSLQKKLKDARRISDKTQRDKFYLEIFDNAIDSGNVDLAARIGEKLSTPELRQLTRDIIANSAK